MNNQEMSLFDAIRIAEAIPEGLAADSDELRILKTKTTKTLKAVACAKEVFGFAARVKQ
jgi:hypothetical protein